MDRFITVREVTESNFLLNILVVNYVFSGKEDGST